MSSFALALYRGATHLFEPAAGELLRRRERQGKEDRTRLGERLGHAAISRPPGPLAWIHGASVGEGLAVLPLTERLNERGFTVLLTTGTVTSSRVLATRLGPRAIHQFVPLDLPGAVRRFFDHWRPDLVCFAESELWPNLLREARKRSVPAAVINGRMSARSFARWQRAPGLIRPLLDGFDVVLAQSAPDAARFGALGAAQVLDVGNLKFDAAPPPADLAEVEAMRQASGSRPVWIAASTHAGEDTLCLSVHQALAARWPDLLTIVVPRKVDRGEILAAEAQRLGITAARRSRQDAVQATTGVYLADTMGEIGLFYRLAPIVFVGKSLGEARGGQNPIEPAKLGCAILHGPNVANFTAVYEALDDAGAAALVNDAAQLAVGIATFLSDPEKLTAAIVAGRKAVDALSGATDRTMEALAPILARVDIR